MNALNLPLVMGHRGAPSLAPENTLEGIRAAFEAGALWTEVDVCLLGDGTPVIFHDSTLDRCTDHSGSVASLGVEDLRRVNANRQFPDRGFAAIPRLDQALGLLGDLGMGLNLELKRHDHVKAAALVEAVASELVQSDFPADKILLSSFDFDVLRGLRAALPDLALAVIAEDLTAEVLAIAGDLQAHSLNLWWERLSHAQTEEALAAGFCVNVWTTNDPQAVVSMRAWGVTGFISDCPQDFGEGFRTKPGAPTDEG